MEQIEDIIRAFGLDIEKIDQNIISRYADDVDKKAIREWYDNMISGMVNEPPVSRYCRCTTAQGHGA